ncbi:hypothetical protein EKK58_00045 [Candidatus Dependentiae bacterium]|nr:MAG: hypothetical protein EKK58_00045 [Candidatus Dependentiae bacterium]
MDLKMIKAAVAGAPPQGSPDQQFEQGFFQLAYDKLQSKLYNLLPYMVGFEVVNKASDGTKAVGVFGFKSDNGQIIYVPAFFINGKVKDLDVMYSRNNNQFYPLNEDYAELFLKDDATGLGGVSEQSRKDIEKQNPGADMRDLVFPPRTGRISYASVIDFISDGDDNIKAAAWGLMNEYPEFTEALHRFYNPEELAAALKPVEKVAAPQSSVEVVTPETAPPELKVKAMTSGFAVIDRRKEDAKSRYGILSYTDKFTNPAQPGFYAYLTCLGTLRHGLILQPLSLYANFRSKKQLVIDLQAKRTGQCYVVPEGEQIFVREAYQIADFGTVHKLMENPIEAEPSFSRTYVLVNEQLKSTEPFRVRMNYQDDKGNRRLKVEPDSWFGDGYRWKDTNQFDPKKKDTYPITLVFTKRESDTLEYRGNVVYVPKGFKLLEVTTSNYVSVPWSSTDTEEQRTKKREEANAEEERIKQGKPGKICDLTSFLRENGIFPFTVRSNGSEYFANVGQASKKYDNPLKAKIGMILDFGLDESDAIELVEQVSELKPVEGYFKIAVTGDYVHTLQDEPESYNELGQPTTFGIPYQSVAPTDHYYQGDPTQRGLASTEVDQGAWGGARQDVNSASQMAANGQKEIFDTSAIATISKYVDPTSKVINYLPNFVDSLDKLGRMLFMIYWETDKFQKMYGVDELPELIELIKSVFRNLGDLVIFLKRKFPDVSINVNEQDTSEGG